MEKQALRQFCRHDERASSVATTNCALPRLCHIHETPVFGDFFPASTHAE